jgi:hypothetical protein
MGNFSNKCYMKNFIHRFMAEQVGIALMNLTCIWYPVLSALASAVLTVLYDVFSVLSVSVEKNA